jgi:S1-C subfamily serine protease
LFPCRRIGSVAGGLTLAAGLILCGSAHGAILHVAGLHSTGLRAGGASTGQGNHTSLGYLGIDVRDISDDQVALLRLHDTRGAIIIKVDHDGPAGKIGLRERDVVVQMNGVAIEGEEQIRRMLREMAPGRTVELVILRDGQSMTKSTQMADRDQVERQAWVDHLGGPQAPAAGLPTGGDEEGAGFAQAGPPVGGSKYGRGFLGTLLMSPTYTGAVLEKMGPQLAGFFGVQGGPGLLVRSIEANSPAALAGMRAGDVVVRANAHAVGSLSEWAKLIKEAKGRPVTVVVMRDRAERSLTLTPDLKRRSSLETAPQSSVVACLTDL